MSITAPEPQALPAGTLLDVDGEACSVGGFLDDHLGRKVVLSRLDRDPSSAGGRDYVMPARQLQMLMDQRIARVLSTPDGGGVGRRAVAHPAAAGIAAGARVDMDRGRPGRRAGSGRGRSAAA